VCCRENNIGTDPLPVELSKADSDVERDPDVFAAVRDEDPNHRKEKRLQRHPEFRV
jgi:hypothetical protein